jgi:integrase
MGKNRMQSQTRLVRRGAVYYFRARVPADLADVLRKREIIESLKTKDKKDAEARVRVRSVQLDKEFEQLRRERAVPPKTSITDEEITRIVAKATSVRLGADEEGRVLGLSDEEFARLLAWLEEAEAATTSAVARGLFTDEFHAQVEDWLWGHGYDLTRDSEGYRRFAFAFAKAQARINQQVRARNRGEPVDTPPAPPEAGREGGSMDDLADYWKKQKNPRTKTWKEAESILRRFAEVNGLLAPSAVQRKHVVAFRDALVDKGRAPGTVKKLLGLLSGMFQVAVEDEQYGVQTNPVRDVKVRGQVGEAKPRKAFSVDDLRAIFSSPVFVAGKRPKAGAGDATFWLPLLGLYTGARLNEIGQIRVADVRTEDGISFIHFTDEGEGMQLKAGRKSRKRVPLHRELIRLGFLNFVEDARRAGRPRLFEDLRPDSHGHLTGRWSKWFGRYLTSVGIVDPGKDFHSFRHTFKHYARVAGIPEDQHDALTGHANASVSRTYGGAEGFPLGPLANAISRLEFKGLDLSAVHLTSGP